MSALAVWGFRMYARFLNNEGFQLPMPRNFRALAQWVGSDVGHQIAARENERFPTMLLNLHCYLCLLGRSERGELLALIGPDWRAGVPHEPVGCQAGWLGALRH